MDPVIYEQLRSKMARTGMAFGIASIVSAIIFFSLPYIAIGFGAFGILFSVLGKGHLPKYGKEGKIGITSGVIGLVICIGILVSVVTALKTNPEYRSNIAELMSTMYGSEFEDTYGISIDDALNEALGK